MIHTLPELPFPKNALQPWISIETFEYHHGKHHAGYVKKLNELIQNTEFEELPLLDILKTATGPIFNNAAQHWNHSFFWNCLTPEKQKAKGDLALAIERDFGSFDRFAEQFKKMGAQLFGSGWTWLVCDESGKLILESTKNADTPIVTGRKPLLVCDVWEHAYYIDHRNDRPKFLEHFFKVANWEFAEQNLSSISAFEVNAA